MDDPEALCERVADDLIDGRVVGWFQGRLEWGPRALGNRSILADPRRPDIRALLNARIKRRESFRPFAPSVLREEVSQWFDCDEDAPYMAQVVRLRDDKRGRVPAVTHVDGSARVQTVSALSHPRFHALISAFHRKTGVPMLVITGGNLIRRGTIRYRCCPSRPRRPRAVPRAAAPARPG